MLVLQAFSWSQTWNVWRQDVSAQSARHVSYALEAIGNAMSLLREIAESKPQPQAIACFIRNFTDIYMEGSYWSYCGEVTGPFTVRQVINLHKLSVAPIYLGMLWYFAGNLSFKEIWGPAASAPLICPGTYGALCVYKDICYACRPCAIRFCSFWKVIRWRQQPFCSTSADLLKGSQVSTQELQTHYAFRSLPCFAFALHGKPLETLAKWVQAPLRAIESQDVVAWTSCLLGDSLLACKNELGILKKRTFTRRLLDSDKTTPNRLTNIWSNGHAARHSFNPHAAKSPISDARCEWLRLFCFYSWRTVRWNWQNIGTSLLNAHFTT